MLVACTQCGKKVNMEPNQLNDGRKHVFCSNSCKNEHRRVIIPATCHVCKKEINITRQQKERSDAGRFFCSRGCYYTHQRSLGEKTKCDMCGKEKPLHKHSKIRNKHNFCSKECENAFIKKARINLICKQCGKKYERSKSTAKTSNYCSARCRWDSRRTYVCAKCKKPIRKKAGGSPYCRKCRNEMSRQYQTKSRENRSTAYVRMLVHMQTGIRQRDVPDELVDLKKVLLKAEEMTPKEIQKTCHTCGKAITVKISRLLDRNFCSNSCASTYRWKTEREVSSGNKDDKRSSVNFG